jgi:hypothetical protein
VEDMTNIGLAGLPARRCWPGKLPRRSCRALFRGGGDDRGCEPGCWRWWACVAWACDLSVPAWFHCDEILYASGRPAAHGGRAARVRPYPA